MRKLNGLKWLFALAIISGTANADVIIDNQSIPASDISGISITPNSGDLYVTTIPGYTVEKTAVYGGDVAINSFSVSPNTILAGGSANLSWSTANADSCTASGGVGDWAGSVATNGTQTITTSVEGTHQFTLTCIGLGDPAVSNVNLTVNSATAVAITSFTASPSTIAEGETTTLSWATQNASSCTASGAVGVDGWSGTVATQSAGTQITIDTAGVYGFTLTCVDAESGEDVSNSVVTVSQASMCDEPALTGNIEEWQSFWQVNFPNPTYDNKFLTITRYGYKAIKFNTGNISSNGRFTTIETTVTDGVRLGAISQCPGDFDVEPECNHLWGISGSVKWATNGQVGSCALEPNTDYYINLTYTDGTNPSSSTCNSSPCVTTLQHINR